MQGHTAQWSWDFTAIPSEPRPGIGKRRAQGPNLAPCLFFINKALLGAQQDPFVCVLFMAAFETQCELNRCHRDCLAHRAENT